MGHEYAVTMYQRPDLVVNDFRKWIEDNDKKIFIYNNQIRNFVRYSFKHRIITKPKFLLFKKQQRLTNTHIAAMLCYKNENSFRHSLFRWTPVSELLKYYELFEQLPERAVA